MVNLQHNFDRLMNHANLKSLILRVCKINLCKFARLEKREKILRTVRGH